MQFVVYDLLSRGHIRSTRFLFSLLQSILHILYSKISGHVVRKILTCIELYNLYDREYIYIYIGIFQECGNYIVKREHAPLRLFYAQHGSCDSMTFPLDIRQKSSLIKDCNVFIWNDGIEFNMRKCECIRTLLHYYSYFFFVQPKVFCYLWFKSWLVKLQRIEIIATSNK